MLWTRKIGASPKRKVHDSKSVCRTCGKNSRSYLAISLCDLRGRLQLRRCRVDGGCFAAPLPVHHSAMARRKRGRRSGPYAPLKAHIRGRSDRIGITNQRERARSRARSVSTFAVRLQLEKSPDQFDGKDLAQIPEGTASPWPPRSLHVSRPGGLLQRHRLSAPRDNRGRRGRRVQSGKPNPLTRNDHPP
jgi:hypothetical protein